MADRRNVHFEEDFDYGLEWCEDLVIQSWDQRVQHRTEAGDSLLGLAGKTKRLLAREAKFDELSEQLAPHAEVVEFSGGELMVEIGSHPEGLQLLVSGLATAHDGPGHHRLREYGRGSVLTGPAAFGYYESKEEVQAEEECRVLLLTRRAREALESEDPDLAMKLYSYLLSGESD